MSHVTGSLLQRAYYRYRLGPDHPMKLRFCGWLRKVLPHGRVVVPYHALGRIAVDETDHVEREILIHGSYEPEVFDSLMNFAAREEVVWDVGAHVGSFSVRAMLDPRVAITYAFEPFPENFRRLAFNVSLNTGNCVMVNAGLSDQPGSQAMAEPPHDNSAMAAMTVASSNGGVAARCFSADYLVQSGYMRSPTLMKIDVEGWELRVLQGASQILRHHPPAAIVFEAECDPQGRIINTELVAFLQSHGYHLSRITRPRWGIQLRENYLAAHDAAAAV